MKIKFIKDFPIHEKNITVGDEYDVILKKEPDKFRGYSEYQIKVEVDGIRPRIINVPEMFVEEMREIA